MPASPARVAAFEILLQVARAASYASELLHSSAHAGLSPSDHNLATELVMGVLRWQSLLDEQISSHSSQKLPRLDPEVLIALRLAAYQLLFLDRIPERAAVHESVELVKRARKRSAVPFTNAVLRRLTGVPRPDFLGRIDEANDASGLSGASAHPEWLVQRWVKSFGLGSTRQICRFNQTVPETAIRVIDTAAMNELANQGIKLAPGRLLASARRLVSGDLTATAAFREGRVAIQEEASQLVAHMVGSGDNMLDCCAAPGGKTRIIAEQNPQATITALDVHSHRARLLRSLASAPNIRIVVGDARALPFQTQFDRVLADVPCSGTGTLARNPDLKWRLQPQDLFDLRSRQLEILQSAMQPVAPRGRLIYSTCSLEEEENLFVVKEALLANPSFRLLDVREELQRLHSRGELIWSDFDSLASGPFLRTLPGVHPVDGFFAAILERYN